MSNNICITDTSATFDYYTKVSNPINSDEDFYFVFCFKPADWWLNSGIRNILVYANLCHPTCKSCSGSANN